VRLTGATFSARLRPDGSLVPRHDFIQPEQNRTHSRAQQRIPLGGRRSIDGIVEVFNVFNRTNYTISSEESNAAYLLPTAGQYRGAEIGSRLSFEASRG